MGLDVTAYSSLTRVERELSQGDRESGLYFIPCVHETWPDRIAPLDPEIGYVGRDQLKFRAGSYGNYNRWRDWLARLAGYPSARHVWENGGAGPFIELINFSDCEGTIGSTQAKKLARDFAEFDERAKTTGDAWEYDCYRLWRMSFELAADDGAVDLH